MSLVLFKPPPLHTNAKLVKSKKTQNYFNCYINQKHYICSFLNEDSLLNFTHFLCKYKQVYDEWPLFTDEVYKLKLNRTEHQQDLFDIFNNELEIVHESRLHLLSQSVIGGIGVLALKKFDYSLCSTKVEIDFSGYDLFGSDDNRLSKKNTISRLNNLFKN